MWWLDESLFRGGRGDSGRFLYRGSVSVPANPSVSSQKGQRKRRKLELTAAQIAVNQSLLGLDSQQEEYTKQLRADVESLERAIREQKSKLQDVETRREQELIEHGDDLAGAKQIAEQTIAQLRDQQSRETQRLRQMLISAESKIRERDSELSELRSQADAREQQNTEALAETKYQHAIDTRHLQSVASAAEQRSAERKDAINKLHSTLHEQEESHRNETLALAQSHETKINQVVSELLQAHHSINSLASELAAGKRELQTLRDEIASVADAMELRRREHADEARRSQAEISQLYLELDRNVDEKKTIDTNTKRERGELSKTIADLQEQLQTAGDRLRQSEAAGVEHVQRVAEFHQTIHDLHDEIAALNSAIRVASGTHAIEKSRIEQEIVSLKQLRDADTERDHGELSKTIVDLQERLKTDGDRIRQFEIAGAESVQQATELQQTILRLRDELAASKSALQLASESSASEKSALRLEIASLRQSLERQQDCAIDQSRHSQAAEWDLRAQCDALQQQLKQVSADAAQRTKDSDKQMTELKSVLAERDEELKSLWYDSEESADQLDRTQGALERIRLENERLLEMHDAQFTTLQSRIDELVVSLDTERHKRAAAEKEARRLCTSRSQRILFLGQQREKFSAQVGQLQVEIDRLRENESKLSSAVASAQQSQRSLQKANARTTETSSELMQLREQLAMKDAELNAIDAGKSQTRRLESEQIAMAREEIACLKEIANRTDLELRERQQQIDQFLRDQSHHDPDFAIVQRDRTIALLEQEAIVMQERLQREAAARRIAEGAMKRKAKKGELDTASQETWTQIEANDQVQRLQRQAGALRNINLLERQRAAAEISRYKKEIERLKDQSNRHAA
jgi:chromosome segregation ATPase